MQNHNEKQWWAPVWKGLVMDAKAKHYRRMKSAVWLYLYLLLNARRGSGVLMRKINTISADMGLTRDTTVRWLNTLRKEGYIVTVNTGRYLTIQVRNWKPLLKNGQNRPQMSGISDASSGKYPTPLSSQIPQILLHSGAKPSVSPTPNNMKINKLLTNETHFMQHVTAHESNGRTFESIGTYAHQELFAWELAKALDDPGGIIYYRSYCRKYPEELLRKVLNEIKRVPVTRMKKSRIALFTHLPKQYAKGTTENPGG